MYGDQLLSSQLEFGILQAALCEQIQRRETVTQLKKEIATCDKTMPYVFHGVDVHSISEPSLARIWGAARSYCLLYASWQHDGTEPIAEFVGRTTGSPLAYVAAVLDLIEPVPDRLDPDACPSQHARAHVRVPLQIRKCPNCEC